MQLSPSELILNTDGSIYHLNLLPTDIATTIITVGDPDRVSEVSQYFDEVTIKKGKREFITHTGTLNGTPISVISTGIGTDNIDIVLNELDALVNIDFQTRSIKEKFTKLNIVRLGTSGAIQPNIPVDQFLLSAWAIGFDNLLHFYESGHVQLTQVSDAFVTQTAWSKDNAKPYVVECDINLASLFKSDSIINGFTATNVGFYGPQGRTLRLTTSKKDLNERLASFRFHDKQITNLEMETSGIYGLSKLLGHAAVSLNCILANRANGVFSDRPGEAMDQLIQFALAKLTTK